jgi:hypothetical protein
MTAKGYHRRTATFNASCLSFFEMGAIGTPRRESVTGSFSINQKKNFFSPNIFGYYLRRIDKQMSKSTLYAEQENCFLGYWLASDMHNG